MKSNKTSSILHNQTRSYDDPRRIIIFIGPQKQTQIVIYERTQKVKKLNDKSNWWPHEFNADVTSSCKNFKMKGKKNSEGQSKDDNRGRRFVKADDPAIPEDDDELLRSGLSHVLLKDYMMHRWCITHEPEPSKDYRGPQAKT